MPLTTNGWKINALIDITNFCGLWTKTVAHFRLILRLYKSRLWLYNMSVNNTKLMKGACYGGLKKPKRMHHAICEDMNATTKEEQVYCVYMHVNKVNDKKYIGITGRAPEQRWKENGEGYKRNPVFYGAIQKYGWDGFDHIIVEDHLTFEEATKKEVELIDKHKTNCFKYHNPSYGYNMTDGGEGNSGRPLSEATKQKLRDAHIGKTLSDEARRKISEANKGRIVSEETRQKISQMKSGENNYWYGKHVPEETKKKLREALSGEKNPMYGQKRPQDIIDKMVQGAKKKWEDPEFRSEMSKKYSEMYSGKNNPKARSIVQLTTDGEFIRLWDYIGEAATYIGVSESCIRACCKGEQQTSGGYKWMYKEVYERWEQNKDLLS